MWGDGLPGETLVFSVFLDPPQRYDNIADKEVIISLPGFYAAEEEPM